MKKIIANIIYYILIVILFPISLFYVSFSLIKILIKHGRKAAFRYLKDIANGESDI